MLDKKRFIKLLTKYSGVLKLIAEEILQEKFGKKESDFFLFFTVVDSTGEDTTIHNIEFSEEVEILDVIFQEFIEFEREKNKPLANSGGQLIDARKAFENKDA